VRRAGLALTLLALAACTSPGPAPAPDVTSPAATGVPTTSRTTPTPPRPVATPSAPSSTSPPAFSPPALTTPLAGPSPRLPSQRAPIAPAPPPRAAGNGLLVEQPATCQEVSAARFVVAVSARHVGPVVQVTGHPATAECGGRDGVRYTVAPDLVDVRLVPDALVALLAGDGTAADLRPLAQDALPGRLAGGGAGPTFLVTGPWSAATALTEQARP